MAYRLISGVALLCLGLFTGPGYGQAESGEKIYQRTVKGTVWILARHEKSFSMGTGSLIDKSRRLVVTNYHVVGDSDKVYAVFAAFHDGKPVPEDSYYWQLLRKGGAISGRVIARDSKRDLALLELDSVPAGAVALRLAHDGVSPGQLVHSVGNPGRSGARWVYTSGTVRTQPYHKRWGVKERDIMHQFDAQVFETQSPTNQGDSGGPLVNDRGELVGVTHGYAAEAQLLSLFIDISEVKHLLARNKISISVAPSATASNTETQPKPVAGKTAELASEVDQITEQRAATKLKFAKTLADEGKTDKARDRFKEIISSYPSTSAAAEAKLLLDKLNK
jgi:S1-C subfamily serine protease